MPVLTNSNICTSWPNLSFITLSWFLCPFKIAYPKGWEMAEAMRYNLKVAGSNCHTSGQTYLSNKIIIWNNDNLEVVIVSVEFLLVLLLSMAYLCLFQQKKQFNTHYLVRIKYLNFQGSKHISLWRELNGAFISMALYASAYLIPYRYICLSM